MGRVLKAQGGSNIDLVYVCACLFYKFGMAIGGFSSETKEPKFIYWVYFELIIVKSTQFGAKLDAFLSKKKKKKKEYTDGWVYGQNIGIEKVKFSRFGKYIHVWFWQK